MNYHHSPQPWPAHVVSTPLTRCLTRQPHRNDKKLGNQWKKQGAMELTSTRYKLSYSMLLSEFSSPGLVKWTSCTWDKKRKAVKSSPLTLMRTAAVLVIARVALTAGREIDRWCQGRVRSQGPRSPGVWNALPANTWNKVGHDSTTKRSRKIFP